MAGFGIYFFIFGKADQKAIKLVNSEVNYLSVTIQWYIAPILVDFSLM